MIITFYSYKGGTGRTMALANVASLLAKRGKKVLAVDFDLEAPGLWRYFEFIRPGLEQRCGLIDLLTDASQADHAMEIDWRDYTTTVHGRGFKLSLITSGKLEDAYPARVLEFDWKNFFKEKNGGEFIERLRNQWNEEYDFILIDSRTGITDIGGICTIMLPDLIVAVFSSNMQSLDGLVEVIARAQERRDTLAYDRPSAAVLPILSRFDSRSEYEAAQHWLDVSAAKLVEFYSTWLPSKYTARQALERTKLPYVAYFSIGEKLPALEADISDPESLGYALNSISQLLETQLEDADVVMGTPLDVQAATTPLRDGTQKTHGGAGAGTEIFSVTLLGAPTSGKTTYIAALPTAVGQLNQRSSNQRWKIVGADDASNTALIRLTQLLSYEHRFPEATALGVERYSWQLLGPAWRTVRRRWLGSKRVLGTFSLRLKIVDASGEIAAAPRRRSEMGTQLIDELADSRGLIFLFDPIFEFATGRSYYYLFSVLAELAKHMLVAENFVDQYLPHYVAVCITKFDDTRVLEAAERLHLTTIEPSDPYAFPRVASDDARELFAKFIQLSEHGETESLLNVFEQYFRPDRIKYFVTSSIGFYVDPATGMCDPDDVQNALSAQDPSFGQRIRGAIHPINVVEPLLWLGELMPESLD